MYLVLVPIRRMDGQPCEHFEANYLSDAVEVSRALKKDGVQVYKLDCMARISKIDIKTKEYMVA